MADYQGLGFDPAPGDAEAVTAASRRWSAEIPALPTIEAWSGEAAAALAARLERARAELTQTREILRAGAGILDDWAGAILANQRRAEQLDRRALALKRALREASDEVESTTTAAQFATGQGALHAEAERAAAVRRHDELARELDRIRQAARDLESDHLATARRVADRLRALDADGAEAAAKIPDRAELYGGIVATLNTQSELGRELASTLSRGTATGAPTGGAHAFAAAFGPK